ncbi:MAG TPA: TIGR03013 family XrtA/PEP-CTERM system glycosyltransferase, partial [Verrucomicrobiae bacterium]|nr:TIGR03013 family XrtA/PEP-CTERM system glycosyltransferase [Verrucomicrobiae bacterium]
PPLTIGRGVLPPALAVFGILQYLLHSGYEVFGELPGLARKVLILGTGPLANQMGAVIVASGAEYKLSGYVRCSSDRVEVPADNILADEGGLMDTVRREKAEHIVVSLSERRGVFPIHDVMKCRLSGVDVMDAPTFYEQVTGKLWVENLTPSSFIFSTGFRIGWLSRRCKRAIDVAASTAGLLFISPFLPLVALLIKLDSRGPALFSQERVGEGEKRFMLYKFRTMRTDAEAASGAVWATENDPRVTRLGRFLRKSRIDEIPQLFNVIRGDMSLVGPRPERPEFVEKLKEVVPYYSERHFVKPGVTGWAQVRYPYGASVEDALEKLRYDLYYIKNFSLLFDLMILADTIKVVLFRRGGR